MNEDAVEDGLDMGPDMGLQRLGLYPIRTVSRLTGVPSVTLRAWERRYRLITPTRTEKGHRLYTEADIARVRQVLALLERGVGVGQVGSCLERAANDADPGRLEPPASVPASPAPAGPLTAAAPRPEAEVLEKAPTAGFDPWPAYIAAMLEGTRRFDAAALDAVYNDALSLYPIERVSSHLTTPVLELLGADWPQGEASIAREHFFSNFLRNKLGARFQHLNALGQGPRLVAACPAGEHHELGLIQFALAAAGQGYRLVMLGADVPATEIAAAARIADCRAVVLSASAQMPAEALAQELAALVALTSLPILVGGMASIHSPQVITVAGARPLGTEFTQALRHIGECLGWPQAANAGRMT
jgi:DNA-binding transcriptional MerR regulator/methylmalonyl-CoA mutase cobalamin-binding subunit